MATPVRTRKGAETEKRKADHVSIALTRQVEARRRTSGLECVEFVHQALPELDFSSIDTSVSFLGKKLKAPLMITAATGGFEKAGAINKALASACEEAGIAFGLGSQRAMIENHKLVDSYKVRGVAPNVFLCGNIGAVQLKHYPCKLIAHAVSEIEADALCVHLNALQEVVQPEGDRDWSGALEAIATLCAEVGVPVIAKETGSGISGDVARELANAGVKAIDVSGVGGTSWSGVESYRGAAETGNTFWDWGITTAESLKECSHATRLPLIASGGVRNGLDVARAIRLGATLGGGALPFVKAHAKGSQKAVAAEISRWAKELKIAMLLSRSRNLQELARAKIAERHI
ncbi:MAG: type 2 isopentenyl-diphosphate Delta-isomerase [Candidatus Micrarchaeia archaeon]|jgi:isopentenyl-diphosphate delta-isomerase